MTRQISPETIRAVADELGEDRTQTASALSASVPSVVAALSDVARTNEGAAHLESAVANNARAARARRSEASELLRPWTAAAAGRDPSFLDAELGLRSWQLSDAVAESSGIRRDSAHKLQSGVTSMALETLGRTVEPQSAPALLEEQRVDALRSMPSTMASTFEARAPRTVTPEVARVRTADAIQRTEAPRRRWLIPALLAAALVLFAIPWLRGRTARAPDVTTPTATQPATPQVPAPTPAPTEPTTTPSQPPQAAAPTEPEATPPQAAAPTEPAAPPQAAAPTEPAAPPQAAAPTEPAAPPQATAPTEQEATAPAEPEANRPALPADSPASEMAAFLADGSGDPSKRFTLSSLTFKTASAEPSPTATRTLDDVAQVMEANPAATLEIESFTDNVGKPALNESLSSRRSDAVKAALVERGVDADRIQTAGMGEKDPIADNATAAGRKENRRTEVVVTR